MKLQRSSSMAANVNLPACVVQPLDVRGGRSRRPLLAAGARAWCPGWHWPLICTWPRSFSHSHIRRRSLDLLRTLPTPSSGVNKTPLKVVSRILGPRTSRVESGKGTGQWEAIMENRSAGFTICPYLVPVMVLFLPQALERAFQTF